MINASFWRGLDVLVTGHTGFKGSWLCRLLSNLGSRVWGFALAPEADAPSLFRLAGIESRVKSNIGDIRDMAALRDVFKEAAPAVVLHLAAQPLVLEGYRDPVGTFAVNALGTAHALECARHAESVRSVLNVTTDKVYRNLGSGAGFAENDLLDGDDPYANSKSCSELITGCWRRSFCAEPGAMALSTARAGNVIGGGDFSVNRIVPDCARAALSGQTILIRQPLSIRPYQHVLEPLFAYLMLAERQAADPSLSGAYNIGPNDADCLTTGELATLFCEAWGSGLAWREANAGGPPEAEILRLDCSRIRQTFGWRPRWDARTAIARTVEWIKGYASSGDVGRIMDAQIDDYAALADISFPDIRIGTP